MKQKLYSNGMSMPVLPDSIPPRAVTFQFFRVAGQPNTNMASHNPYIFSGNIPNATYPMGIDLNASMAHVPHHVYHQGLRELVAAELAAHEHRVQVVDLSDEMHGNSHTERITCAMTPSERSAIPSGIDTDEEIIQPRWSQREITSTQRTHRERKP
eukprot:IDg5181t1